MAAGARDVGTGVQALEDLADGRLLLEQPVIEHAHQLHLALIHHEVAGHSVLARHVAVAVGSTAAEIVAVAGALQLAAAEPLAQNGALILGNRALDLQQQLVVGVVRDGMMQEYHLAAGAAELLQEQDLVSVFAGKPVRREHSDLLDGAVAHGVSQRVQTGTVEPAATVALVAEHVLFDYGVASRRGPGVEGGELTVDGLLAFLSLGRDAGVEGRVHDSMLLDRGAEGGCGGPAWPLPARDGTAAVVGNGSARRQR